MENRKILKYIQPILLITIWTAFAGCLKNNQYYVDLSKVSPSIQLPLAAANLNGVVTFSFNVSNTPDTLPVYVNVASPNPLNTPVTATLGLDTAYLNQYNTNNGTNYELLPDSTYSVTGWDLTVPAGQRLAFTNVIIYTTKINASKSYILPITIVKSSLPIENWNHLLLNIGARNQYDGVYVLTGYASHPTNATLTGPYGPINVDLITSGINSVVMFQQHPWSNSSNSVLPSGYQPNYTIDPNTFQVTVTNQVFGNTVLNSPGYNSHYDPNTRTIYAAWQYNGSGGTRTFIDTLTYISPR
ncbi:MAG: DUF1735 domain-containing protein [Thermoflavifilum sp.]|uniref:DUF1735 domain-containing protein n=1 Tax=Thermoflavifilum sp. TaxID=1968839 RepID=UPI0018A43B3A|nr:DUF1735 domain-containing protein [Thermoflavifilum sp.]QOR76259.1 MAG: DUF1735 domain-containing protein [Thermoflavifilum sp.]